jgi:peptidyl-tRNA hydrolase ICT1
VILRTETKAITSWSVTQLMSILPKMLHSGLRASKYYAERNDCISLQAQTSRSRTANAEENHQKLFEEIQRLYDERVPSETSPEKRQKYAQLCVFESSS